VIEAIAIAVDLACSAGDVEYVADGFLRLRPGRAGRRCSGRGEYPVRVALSIGGGVGEASTRARRPGLTRATDGVRDYRRCEVRRPQSSDWFLFQPRDPGDRTEALQRPDQLRHVLCTLSP
jgi:hypothetical protein